MRKKSDNRQIIGLVLAGGRSRRMGRDKGSLIFHGDAPQVRYVWTMLNEVCDRALVSAYGAQCESPAYHNLPLIADLDGVRGPAAGLLGAWSVHPDSALLVVAVDMPLVGLDMLNSLVAARDSQSLATAFAHPDGTLEPLCTLWEARARGPVAARAASGKFSLRELLEESSVVALEVGDPSRLVGVNTIEDYSRVRQRLRLAGG